MLNLPADTSGITVNYTGAKVARITYSATATSLPDANVSTVVLTPGALAQHLYVANQGGQCCNGNSTGVSVYNTSHGNVGLPEITGGDSMARGVAVDATGKLYGAYFGRNSLSV